MSKLGVVSGTSVLKDTSSPPPFCPWVVSHADEFGRTKQINH